MFRKLSQAITKTVQSFGQKQLSPELINQVCHDIRMTLIDADVAQEGVEHFLSIVKDKASQAERMSQVTAQNQLFSIIHSALVDTLGTEQTSPPVSTHGVFMLAGLQGSGKTTTAAKLAHWLSREHKKTVCLTSVDFQRPAAIDQLETLASQINVPFIRLSPTDNIKKVIEQESLKYHADITIVDTAGRITIDHELMGELKAYHTMLKPRESLFVVDSLTGQDAANVAKEFHQLIDLTGVILTKTDGDSRGGAALSVKTVTGKPIKFIGTGEKIDAFDLFDAERIASRILDLGDIAALVKKMQDTVDEDKAKQVSKKIKKGDFDFDDFLDQLSQLKKMGGLTQIMSMLPGTQNIPEQLKSAMDDDHFK